MEIMEAGVSSESVRYIFTPSSFAEQMFYYPTRMGHYFCSRQYRFSYQSEIAMQAGHIFNYMIFFVKSGQMDISVDGERKSVGSRELVIFDCQKPYEYQALTDDLEFYWLLFNGGQSAYFFEQLLLIYESHMFTTNASDQIEVLFVHLLEISGSMQRLSERLYSEKIYSLLCLLAVSESGGEDIFAEVIDKAITFMDCNFNKVLTVDDVASYVGMSTSYFSRQFRLRTGYPPYEYLTRQRINRAKELLVSTNLTVLQIGYETGYNSEDNFIKSFKKKVGVSPNTYRRFPV